MELMQASVQWAKRPSDERFLSLTDMQDRAHTLRANSAAKVIANRDIQAVPASALGYEDKHEEGLYLVGPNGAPVAPTHFSFGQLAQRAGAPAGYLRDLPAPLAADCVNYGMKMRDVEEVGVLLQRREAGAPASLAAMTGPNYGRIWNETILDGLVRRFGDGRTGTFRVPGEFGQQVDVTKANTTLYMGDRDFFVFLADEENRIEFPGSRRKNAWNGTALAPGLARGFFCWNSEVGSATFGVAQFLFDYACSNRIVWGARDYQEITIRHTKGAPHRFIEEVAPALERMRNSSTAEPARLIASAQDKKLGEADKVREFLNARFSKSQTAGILAAHVAEEQRPIETLWDAVTGVTAYAKSIEYQDARVAVEREAGKILSLAA